MQGEGDSLPSSCPGPPSLPTWRVAPASPGAAGSWLLHSCSLNRSFIDLVYDDISQLTHELQVSPGGDRDRQVGCGVSEPQDSGCIPNPIHSAASQVTFTSSGSHESRVRDWDFGEMNSKAPREQGDMLGPLWGQLLLLERLQGAKITVWEAHADALGQEAEAARGHVLLTRSSRILPVHHSLSSLLLIFSSLLPSLQAFWPGQLLPCHSPPRSP